VLFDLRNDGHPDCYSWPVIGSGNAFLVLDRDADHVIDSGDELFGNWTPLPGQAAPPTRKDNDWNGFLALAAYDLPTNGGDLDGVLDKDDAIWSKLKLWIDTHCALTPSQPCSARRSELHALEEFGITSISLTYEGSSKVDAYGNVFRFASRVNPAIDTDNPNSYSTGKSHHRSYATQKSADGRWAYDVYLQTKQ